MQRPAGLPQGPGTGHGLLAPLLALPMMLAIRPGPQGPQEPLPASLAHPPRHLTLPLRDQHQRPGVIIGLLYVRLARAYWLSQRASFTQTRRLPNPRVLYLILGIVLLFWACFLPLAVAACPVPWGLPLAPAPPALSTT